MAQAAPIHIHDGTGTHIPTRTKPEKEQKTVNCALIADDDQKRGHKGVYAYDISNVRVRVCVYV